MTKSEKKLLPVIDPVHVGKRVRILRTPDTQTETARALRVDQVTLHRIEHGTLGSLSWKQLNALHAWAVGKGSSLGVLLGIGDLAAWTDEQLINELTRRRIVGDVRRRAESAAPPLSEAAYSEPPRERQIPIRGRTMRIETVCPEDVPTDPGWHEHYVPILGRIAAGQGVASTAEASAYPPGWAGEYLVYDGAPPTAVAVRVAGDSMMPHYRPGDVVVVDPAQPTESGEIACVIVVTDGHEEPRIKRLRIHRDAVLLESLNPAHKPERIPREMLRKTCKIIDHIPA